MQKRTWVLLDIIYDGNIGEMGHSGLKNVFGPLNQALRLFELFIVFGAQLNCDQGRMVWTVGVEVMDATSEANSLALSGYIVFFVSQLQFGVAE